MAYDKLIDSAFLEGGLKDIADKIREKGGGTESLSFPEGFLLAIEALGTDTPVLVLNKYSVSLQDIRKSTGNTMAVADWVGQTFYKSVSGSPSSLTGGGGFAPVVPADITGTSGRYLIKGTEIWHVDQYSMQNYSLTCSVYDTSLISTASKSYVDEAENGKAEGEFLFDAGPAVYCYAYGEAEEGENE